MSSSPYAPAARLLGSIWTSRKSLKTLAYDKKGTLTVSKATYAQVSHVLETKSTLDAILQQVPIESRNTGLLYVLLYELLLGPNQSIRGGGALKRLLLQHEEPLRAVLTTIQENSPTTTTTTTTNTFQIPPFPRYVRVNTLVTTMKDVLLHLKTKHIPVYLDPHVPHLLVLPPKTVLPDLVAQGNVVLQDKSSCFSALCLASNLMGDCLDACAAPGNKTSHLCMLLANHHHPQHPPTTTTTSKQQQQQQQKQQKRLVVVACDRNQQRFQMMNRRLIPLIPTTANVQLDSKLVDFLTLQPKEYPNVKGILLDPSCSGSGMFHTTDNNNNNDHDTKTYMQRIHTLSNFQVTALRHAMSFPNVTTLIYSTCSIHEEENEHVVRQALEYYSTEWTLCAPLALQGWTRRGHLVDGLTIEQTNCMIRAQVEDDTNGFFVAYFERNGSVIPRPTHSPIVEAIEGLESYSGQFKTTNIPTKQIPTVKENEKEWKLTKPQPIVNNKKEVNLQEIKTTKLPKPQPGVNNKLSTTKKEIKISKILVKKAAKKKAWKERQIGQKRARLLQKAEFGSIERKAKVGLLK